MPINCIPSPNVVAYIKANAPAIVAGWTTSSSTDAQVVSGLNAATSKNPITTAPMINPTYTVAKIFSFLSAASVAKVRTVADGQDLLATIRAQDTADLLLWLPVLSNADASGNSIITPAESSSINTFLTTQIADPNYQANVPTVQLTFDRLIDIYDVEYARTN